MEIGRLKKSSLGVINSLEYLAYDQHSTCRLNNMEHASTKKLKVFVFLAQIIEAHGCSLAFSGSSAEKPGPPLPTDKID